jgi:hypothetical protein
MPTAKLERQTKEHRMRKFIIAAGMAAAFLPAVEAFAAPPPWAPANGRRAKEAALYDSRGRYIEPQALSSSDRIWRGEDGRYYCRRRNGTTGLIVGGAVGALLGREIDGGSNRTLGTILGGAGGALLGRELERSNLKCS